jgi:hypothetical protein
MRVAIGQEWELPSVGNADPLVLRIVEEVGDDWVVVHTFRRSAPRTILDRSEMWVRNVIDTGVLVAGPGALDAGRRRERATRLADVLQYAARHQTPGEDGDVRFDGRDIVKMVAADEKVTREQARAILRDALATLGGREITTPYDKDAIGYVLPAPAVKGGGGTKQMPSPGTTAPFRPPRPGPRGPGKD